MASEERDLGEEGVEVERGEVYGGEEGCLASLKAVRPPGIVAVGDGKRERRTEATPGTSGDGGADGGGGAVVLERSKAAENGVGDHAGDVEVADEVLRSGQGGREEGGGRGKVVLVDS